MSLGSVSCNYVLPVNGQDQRGFRPSGGTRHWTSFGKIELGQICFVAGAGLYVDEELGIAGNRGMGFG